MKALVFGGWFGSGNIGDDAILIGLRDIMRAVMPDIELIALSTDPEQTRKICEVESIKLQSPKQLLRNKHEYLNAFNDADAVIVTGGTPIYDYDHLSRIIHMGIPILKRKPLILFGIGAKPVYTLRGRSVLRMLLRHASLISVRDAPSARVLSKITDKQVTVTGDSALCIHNLERKRKTGKHAALICPRILSANNKPLYHEKLSTKTIYCIRRTTASFADWLSENHNVMFIPFHTKYLDDDRQEITQIRQLMKIDNSKEIGSPSSPEHAFNLLGGADILLGLRLHSLILGALAGLPLVSISYDSKIYGFMEVMGIHNYVCPLDNLQFASIRDKANTALNYNNKVQKMLDNSVRRTRSRIMSEAVRVSDYLATLSR